MIDKGSVLKSKEDGHEITVKRIDATMALIKFSHLKGNYAITHESLLKYYKLIRDSPTGGKNE